MKVIDLDSHADPRNEDYVIEAKYSHLRPRMYFDAQGNRRHIFNNGQTLMVSKAEMDKAYTGKKSNWKPGIYDPSIRVEHVKEAGIDLQFIIGRGVGYFTYVEPGLGVALLRAHNDFLYEKFMKPYPKTFMGVPQLPLQDIPSAIKELERCVKDLGMCTFLTATNTTGKTDMADPCWWSLYETAIDLGITGIIVHFDTLAPQSFWVGKDRLQVLGPDGTTGRRILSGPFEYCTNIINLIFGGMMDVFPQLRFAFLEVGAEFAIVLKHRVAENLEQIGYLREMLAHPLDWYFDRFYFLVDDWLLKDEGKRLCWAIEELGPDHLFLGSDYPHADGDLEAFSTLRGLKGLSVEEKEQILGGNVMTLMGDKRGTI